MLQRANLRTCEATWFLAGVVFGVPSLAAAAEKPEHTQATEASEEAGVSGHGSEVDEEHPGAHHAEYPNLAGIRVGFLSIFKPEEEGLVYEPSFLVGLSYERTVIHEWLEIEISVPVATIFGEEETIVALPMDLHFKKPFHPSSKWSPYIALGPTVDLQVLPEVEVFFGGSLAVGTYVWPSSRVGIDIEIDYNIIAENGLAVHELLLAVGPVFRF